MITLCYRSVLHHRGANRETMHFKPAFLEWCADWGTGFEMSVVGKDHNPGYQVDLTYDFEIWGLTPQDEALWVLAWGKSSRHHPAILDDNGLTERDPLLPPYDQYLFTVEVEM